MNRRTHDHAVDVDRASVVAAKRSYEGSPLKAIRGPVSRRAILARGASLALGFVLSVMASRPATAKVQKMEFQYQGRPKDGKRCADCKFFSADASGSGTGTCDLVEGTIDRDGWCIAFSPKAHVLLSTASLESEPAIVRAESRAR
jgi:hypothetical protein